MSAPSQGTGQEVRPLDGVRVIELGPHLPTLYACQLLAGFGAEVIKIEQPRPPGFVEDDREHRLTLRRQVVDRGKLSLALDLKTAVGQEVLHGLVGQSDVFVEGLRPGTVDRLAADYETLSGINPRLVYCSVSSYGQDGPYRNVPGHDINFIAVGGLLGLNGRADEPPHPPGVYMADMGAGAPNAIIGVLLALMARDRTGRGQWVDVAIFDGVVTQLLAIAMDFTGPYKSWPERGRMRSSGNYFPCYGVYEAGDGKYLSLGVFEAHIWSKLCEAIGHPDLRKQQYAAGEEGERAQAQLQALFRQKPRDEWVRMLGAQGVGIAPVNSVQEVFEDPQVRYRGLAECEDLPEFGRLWKFGAPLKLGGTPARFASRVPDYGGDTLDVLHSLGYDDAAIDRLAHEGTIGVLQT